VRYKEKQSKTEKKTKKCTFMQKMGKPQYACMEQDSGCYKVPFAHPELPIAKKYSLQYNSCQIACFLNKWICMP